MSDRNGEVTYMTQNTTMVLKVMLLRSGTHQLCAVCMLRAPALLTSVQPDTRKTGTPSRVGLSKMSRVCLRTRQRQRDDARNSERCNDMRTVTMLRTVHRTRGRGAVASMCRPNVAAHCCSRIDRHSGETCASARGQLVIAQPHHLELNRASYASSRKPGCEHAKRQHSLAQRPDYNAM